MPLTAQQFEQLSRFLVSPARREEPETYGGPERRESPRTAARGVAELRLEGCGFEPGRPGRTRSVTVYIHDISAGGIGLLSGAAVRPAATVDLVLTNGHDDLTVRCAVRHCTVLAVGLYGVGMDVEDLRVDEAPADGPAAEAAAWAGFFNSQRATSSVGLAG